MANSHKAVSSSTVTTTKLDKPSINQSGIAKPKLTKKQIGIVCGIIAVLVAALVVTLVVTLNRNHSQTETSDDTETTQDEPTIDYNQKITDKDGGEFKAEYQAGSEQSFAMRFSDLKCEDNCKNVSEVKLGDKTLKQGEDYEVQSGSIIVILTENFMKSLKADKYNLAIAVVNGDKTSFYGVKFTVKPEPTCGEGETLEKGECVKKPEGQPTQNQTSNVPKHPTSSNATVVQNDLCKTRLVGWDRPSNCPTQTRSEYTALGGWENLVKTAYGTYKDATPMKQCYDSECTYVRGGSISGLCYGAISISLDTMEILSVSWDDSTTSTCDDVRNDHPPLPSVEYLTQYLRSIAN